MGARKRRRKDPPPTGGGETALYNDRGYSASGFHVSPLSRNLFQKDRISAPFEIEKYLGQGGGYGAAIQSEGYISSPILFHCPSTHPTPPPSNLFLSFSPPPIRHGSRAHWNFLFCPKRMGVWGLGLDSGVAFLPQSVGRMDGPLVVMGSVHSA